MGWKYFFFLLLAFHIFFWKFSWNFCIKKYRSQTNLDIEGRQSDFQEFTFRNF